MRFVLVHNHIFKNAGSTIDHVFEAAGFRNTRIEGEPGRETVHSYTIAERVRADPSIEYVSSHVLRRPRPEDEEEVGYIDITFIREPVDRLYSIYCYFRSPAVRDFPEIPKDATFADFIDGIAELAPAHLHSPQTSCLGNHRDFYFPPGPEAFERARATVAATRFLGVVDLFDRSFEVFVRCCRPLFPAKNLAPLAGPFPVINPSSEAERSVEAKLKRIRAELGPSRYDWVCQANAIDLALYHFARQEVLRRHAAVARPAG